jgi:hypothetical protein
MAIQLRVWPCFLLTAVLLAAAILSWSQGSGDSDSKTSVTTDFRGLSDQRAQLEVQIHQTQHQADKLSGELAEIAKAAGAIEGFEGQMADPAVKDKTVAASNLQGWKDTLHRYRDGDIVQKDLDAATQELSSQQKDLTKVEQQIAAALDIEKPKQQFKTELSIAFSILIGFVILGFYAIAANDRKVRATIFSGDAGLQFITLFALVIAIVLFGITDILQARELSALLGGISGYILGRSSTRTAVPLADAPEADSAPDKEPA